MHVGCCGMQGRCAIISEEEWKSQSVRVRENTKLQWHTESLFPLASTWSRKYKVRTKCWVRKNCHYVGYSQTGRRRNDYHPPALKSGYWKAEGRDTIGDFWLSWQVLLIYSLTTMSGTQTWGNAGVGRGGFKYCAWFNLQGSHSTVNGAQWRTRVVGQQLSSIAPPCIQSPTLYDDDLIKSKRIY